MTKKHFVYIALILTVLFAVVFWFYLPMDDIGQRPVEPYEIAAEDAGQVPGNLFMRLFLTYFLRAFFSVFIGMTTAMIFIVLLIFILKRSFVKAQIHTLKHFRYLLFLLIKRDFVTRYRRSVLGVLWSLLNPLLTMLVLTIVFQQIFRFDVGGFFPVYLLSGQIIFTYFSESTSLAMSSISGSAATIKKVYVPKYIFPLSKILSSVVNLGFSFVAFLVVVLVTGAPFHWTMLLVPIPFLYLIIFSLGIGMLLSALSVFFRDVTYLYGVLLTALNFLTPIFYPVAILPDAVFQAIHLNPMFHFVTYFRDLTRYGVIPGVWENIICLGFALAAFFFGLYVKMSQQDKYLLYL